jgi:myo-inositol 2-dehydrogenase / D-chiro-inositol 1-dehydrogenase
MRRMETLPRRTFIKAAAATALAGSSLAHAAQPEKSPAKASGNPVLRIGLIGCGGRGTGAAVQALRADPNTTLVAMGDLFPDRLEGALANITKEMGEAAKDRIRITPDRKFLGFDAYQKVLAAGVDVVLLTTHPYARPIHLAAAIKADKHVFAEKPLAVDSTGLRAVLAAASEAKQKNLALQVGFCWRYAQAEKETFRRVNAGEIGEVTAVHSNYHTSTLSKYPRKPEWSDTEFQIRNWWHFTWVSGDHLVEQAVHSVDRLKWAMGDKLPLRCTALGGRAARTGPESGNAYDHFTVIYEFEGNRRGILTCRQIDNCTDDNSDYVYGTKGAAHVTGFAKIHKLMDLAGAETWKYTGESTDMYQNEHNQLFASIRSGQPINDGERGGHSTLMAIMGRLAAYTGKTVTWEQALNSKEDLIPANLALGPMPTPEIAIPGKTKLI